MANTNKQQFMNLIRVYEDNKHLDNDTIVEAMRDAEPRIKETTIVVYRSNIDTYSQNGYTHSSTSEKFKQSLNEYYGVDSDEVRDENLMAMVTERNELKAKVLELEAVIQTIRLAVK